MIEDKKITAVILAGGKGKRMNSKVSKQYMILEGKPILYYTLKAFENSLVDEIILVTGAGEEAYCRKEIVDRYHFRKVIKIVHGGRERYDSVYQGLCAVENTDIVMIHDGARPFITEEVIAAAAEETVKTDACVVGVRVKDTIKTADQNSYITGTLDRTTLWQVQTPQSFKFASIFEAYEQILQGNTENITDDAMVWEAYSSVPVKLIEGTYYNIKITTEEDMIFGQAILNNIRQMANNKV